MLFGAATWRRQERQVIRKRYWSTGIRIEYTDHRSPAWGGEVDFFDDTLADQVPECGLISTYAICKPVTSCRAGAAIAMRSLT